MSLLRTCLVATAIALICASLFTSRTFVDRRAATAASAPALAADRAPAPGTDPGVCAPEGTTVSAEFVAVRAARAEREQALARTAAFTDWLTAWRRADASVQAELATRGLSSPPPGVTR
jgi:hypothetical protein